MEDFSTKIFLPYADKRNTAGAAMNLIRFATANFNQCHILKELDYLENTLSKRLTKSDIQRVSEIAFNKPVGYFRIILCFENYCKAVLLVNSILINKIEHTHCSTELKKLNKKQTYSPVLFKDFLQHSKWKKDSKGIPYLDFLKKETITFSTTLKDPYNEIIKLPQALKEFLKELNFDRNNIHYFASLSFSNSQTFINNIRSMSTFVNKEMIEFHDNLILENSNIPNRHLINEFKRKIME